MQGVLIIGSHPNGDLSTYVEEDLEFDQAWWEGKKLVLVAYDGYSTVRTIKIDASILMEELLGFAAHIEIRGPIENRDHP